jgi:predicted phosphodiesterase
VEALKAISFDVPDGIDNIRIYPIGDVHLGNVFCDEKELIKTIERVKNDQHGYAVLMGDMLELTTRNSVGDIWGQKLTPWQQIERAAELLEPIKDRIVAVTEGNHELRAFKYDGLLPMRDVASRLRLDLEKVYAIGAGVIFADLHPMNGNEVRTSTHTIYFKHGSGGGKRMGSKANRMEDMKCDVLADVHIMGHTHAQMAFTSATYVPVSTVVKRIEERRSLHVNSGSFLGWGGYAVQFGFSPSFTGAPYLELCSYFGKPTRKTQSVKIST